MFKLDANTGTYQYFTALGGISCMGASPLAVTPDGRVWFDLFDPYGSGPHGLAWFDGVNAGIFTAPRDGGAAVGRPAARPDRRAGRSASSRARTSSG